MKIIRRRVLALVLAFTALLFVLCPVWSHAGPPFKEFIDPHPGTGNQFGKTIVALSTGNVVVTSPYDDAGGEYAGAVYLFNGATGALISTLRGSQGDFVGIGGVTALSNGNYVVSSPGWSAGAEVGCGAVTWCNGSSGINGTVTSSNSLVGSHSNDMVGEGGVTALSNGSYVVSTPSWDNPLPYRSFPEVSGAVNAGAVTWGSGTSGVSGTVSSSNSLVGTTAEDIVGGIVHLSWGGYYTDGGVTALSNGSYVVNSPKWHNASVLGGAPGAVTWGSGTSGVKGEVTSYNSLVTTSDSSVLAQTSVTALTNGNYVVTNPLWDDPLPLPAGTVDAGAVTWCSGSSGKIGAITSSNSLVGEYPRHKAGEYGVTALSNGNYVVSSPIGVTWGSGSSGATGYVSTTNTLIAGGARGSVIPLSNGNYVVVSPYNAGAVTWCSGSAGVSGDVTSLNSLVGTETGDSLGSGGVTALSNGNYVVHSPYWNSPPGMGGRLDAGAVTWGDGSSGVKGHVTTSNSLIGTEDNDNVGEFAVLELSNGNYVVRSPHWNSPPEMGGVLDAGAATWCNGSSGLSGPITMTNSLIGTKANDNVSGGGVTALSNGNYVVCSPNWSSPTGMGGVAAAGAVTLGNGTSGIYGSITTLNSLIGTQIGDSLGSGGATALSNGNYVVISPYWNNGGVEDAGAVTWGSGVSGLSWYVTNSNSLVGTQAKDWVGSNGVTALSNGNYVVSSANWHNAGLVNAGAVTWGSGSSGVSGSVASRNSLVGLTSNAGGGGPVIVDDLNNTYFAQFISEGSGKIRVGSQVNGTALARPAVAQTLVFTTPLKLYMAESPFTLSASTSSGLPIVYTLISGPATVSGNVLTLTGPGAVKLRVSQPGNADFLVATALDRTITVAADPPTLTLTNLSQIYTGTPLPITVLGTAGAVDVTYKVGLVYVPTAPINAGSYLVKAVAGAIIKTGTLVITKAPLFVTPDDQRKFAGQANPVLGFGYSGFLGSDNDANSVSKAPVIATTATAASLGGLYPITASGGTSTNYLFVYLKGTMKVETFAGSYEALLVDGDSIPVGKLSITVAATSKTFTAKLATATETSVVPFSGPLLTVGEQATGNATTLIGTAKVPYRIDFTLPITGNVIASATRNSLPLGSAADGRKLSTATVAYAGVHTAVLEPATSTGSTVPAGAGWATASISTTGVITLAGKLGDGTAFTSALNPDDLSNPGYRLFVQPYLAARAQSLLAGSFTLAEHPTLTGRRYLAQSSLTWKKTGLPADVSYRTGFGPVNTVMMIDPWLAPKTTAPAITLAQRLGLTGTSISFGVSHSDTVSASQTNLPTRLVLSTTNAVSVLTPLVNLTKWKTLTFVPTTGTFTGSFELTDAIKRPVTFSGILRQSATNTDTLIGGGHFLLPPLTGTEKTTGEVMFTRP